jgi:DEAD/DEAH box helicase domain-containing protein
VSWTFTQEAKEPSWVDLPGDLPPLLLNALREHGIEKLYTHQLDAYRLARQGKDFVIVTPTASGKTLCYNLPVVRTLLEDPDARALYVFPTKALSQDQQAELNEIALGGALPVKIHTYDGDTPNSLRIAARTSGRIVITNPDMLHSGILPNHPKWIKFFSKLRFVVIDEMHTYRGVFGSHVALVMRRLERIARFYGSSPVFILSSATMANPVELAGSLLDRKVELIDHNGAGSGKKMIVFYNPPLVDPVQGIRVSSSLESQKIALKLLRMGVKTILFARSRLQVERIASEMNRELANPWNDNEGVKVSPYRSGLLPSERRSIERGLREGEIHGVVSTNALELGIDIGGLDAAVLAGYPGSVASFWQQAGRAGRRGGESLAIFVSSSSPLDQYFSLHKEYFLSQKPEYAHIDPCNPYIFVDHVKCSAFELPFSDGDELCTCGSDSSQHVDVENIGGEPKSARNGGLTMEALNLLEEDGIVRHSGGQWFWSAEGYPGEKISLRSATTDNVVIVDVTGGKARVIGEMDRPSAKQLIFDNAVYIHLGTQYIVKKLDIAERVCQVERKDVDYYTDSIVKTDLHVLTEDYTHDSKTGGRVLFSCSIGDVLVRSQAEKYKKLRLSNNENIGYGDIFLPGEEIQTRALAILFRKETGAGNFLASLDPATAAAVLGGAGRLLNLLAPAFVLCDSRDIGLSERVKDPHFSCPAIFLYDMYPGGTGLAEALEKYSSDVMEAARERVSLCACNEGCPACIGAEHAHAWNKQSTIEFLELCSVRA